MKYYSLLTLIFGLIVVSGSSSMERKKRSLRSVKSLEEDYMQGKNINELLGSIHTTSLREQLERTLSDAGRWLIEHGVHVPYIQEEPELKKILEELYPSTLMRAILFDRTEKQAREELGIIIYDGWGIDNNQLAQIARESFLLAIAQNATETAKLIYQMLSSSLTQETLEEGFIRAAEVGNSEAFDFFLTNHPHVASPAILSQALKMAVIRRRSAIINALFLYEILKGISIDLEPALTSLDTILAIADRSIRDAYRNILEGLEIAQRGRIETFANTNSLINIQRAIQQLREMLAEEADPARFQTV